MELNESERMKGIILHGGHGTRLRPLTHTGAKQLIPVANKPISQYVLEDLREAGVKDIAIIIGGINSEKVTSHYGDGSRFGVTCSFISQEKPAGIAQAVSLCENFVNNDLFIVYLGDNLIKGGIKSFVQDFKESDADAMVLLSKVKNPERFGVAKFMGGKLSQLIEKPKKPPSDFALTGIYFFKPIIFQMIKDLTPSWRGELEITHAIQMLIEKGLNVQHQFVKGWWKDTGSPEEILDANRLVLDDLTSNIEGKIINRSLIQGRVVINKKSVVNDGAIIRGPTIIGENTIIGSKVFIGPYTSIGNNVEIRQGEIENSIIMNNCIIDLDDRIIDSLVAPHTKIISNKENKPSGKKFILGERSNVEF